MIDINTIISQALAAAVEKATAPLLERIATLEKRVFEDLGAIIEQEFIASMAVTDVVGHDKVQALTDRVAAVETKLTEADLFTKTTEGHVNKDELLEYLDNQEWFWGKIRTFTDGAVEQAIENHTDCWDHNDFVTEDKLDDYVKTDNFRDEIEDVINNATIRLNF